MLVSGDGVCYREATTTTKFRLDKERSLDGGGGGGSGEAEAAVNGEQTSRLPRGAVAAAADDFAEDADSVLQQQQQQQPDVPVQACVKLAFPLWSRSATSRLSTL